MCVCVCIYNWNFLQFLLDGNLRCPVGFIRERAIYHHGAHLPCMLSHFSHVQLFATLWNVAHQAPLSMGFSRQESWSGLPFPPLGDLSEPRIEPTLAPAYLDSWPRKKWDNKCCSKPPHFRVMSYSSVETNTPWWSCQMLASASRESLGCKGNMIRSHSEQKVMGKSRDVSGHWLKTNVSL